MRTGFERAEKTVSQCGRFLLATLFLLPSLHRDKRAGSTGALGTITGHQYV
jgi:hypothetical protein